MPRQSSILARLSGAVFPAFSPKVTELLFTFCVQLFSDLHMPHLLTDPFSFPLFIFHLNRVQV